MACTIDSPPFKQNEYRVIGNDVFCQVLKAFTNEFVLIYKRICFVWVSSGWSAHKMRIAYSFTLYNSLFFKTQHSNLVTVDIGMVPRAGARFVFTYWTFLIYKTFLDDSVLFVLPLVNYTSRTSRGLWQYFTTFVSWLPWWLQKST